MAQVNDPDLAKLRTDPSLLLESVPLALSDGLSIFVMFPPALYVPSFHEPFSTHCTVCRHTLAFEHIGECKFELVRYIYTYLYGGTCAILVAHATHT